MTKALRIARGGFRLHVRKRNKFGNKPTYVDGIRFASKKEAKRYAELRLLEQQKKISHLKLQPRFALEVNGRKIGVYVGDFEYRDPINGGVPVRHVVEDVKGVQTPAFRLKFELAKALFPAIDWRLS